MKIGDCDMELSGFTKKFLSLWKISEGVFVHVIDIEALLATGHASILPTP